MKLVFFSGPKRLAERNRSLTVAARKDTSGGPCLWDMGETMIIESPTSEEVGHPHKYYYRI